MRFRTEIERVRPLGLMDHGTPIVLLGSCFTDEIGQRLENDGFDIVRNPFGPLYNPMSICRCLGRALKRQNYDADDLTTGPRGFHCLDYATRFSDPDADGLVDLLNGTLGSLSDALDRKPVVILTLGSAFIYRYARTGEVVGNCHKFPASEFDRSLASPDEIVAVLAKAMELLKDKGIEHVILTVSPIRHLADGLHGNTLSKSTLMLAVDRITAMFPEMTEYFPSYEIMLDDLRDYRFYASDMKHPSEVAVDYIYERFSETYFGPATKRAAADAKSRRLAALHRPIL